MSWGGREGQYYDYENGSHCPVALWWSWYYLTQTVALQTGLLLPVRNQGYSGSQLALESIHV